MNLIELNRSLRQLRLGGIAAVLETRLQQAQADRWPPSTSSPVWCAIEMTRRGDRLLNGARTSAISRSAGDPDNSISTSTRR